MAVISISPTGPIQSVSEMESVENSNASETEAQKNEKEKFVSGTSKSRNKNPGIRVVGNRVYDSENGKSCHQCRQKTKDFAAECKNMRKNKPCPIKYCHKCLSNRYGEKAAEVANLPDWNCPKCRGICNCSLCMKKRGCQPTGILIHTAKANGYSSVSEMLQVDGSTNLDAEERLKDFGSSPKKTAASETDSLNSLRKRGKEDAVDEKVELELQSLSLPPSLDDQNSKKVKLEESLEKQDDGINDEVQGQDEKSNNDDINLDSLENIVISEVILPMGTELTTVHGIEMPLEDVGKALQFLEFCAAFGKKLEVKNGQPECILRDLVDGRSSRPGRFSLTVQFHIRLISLIQDGPVKGSSRSSDLSPARGKDLWVHALKECISGSGDSPKLQFLEHLGTGADGYEILNSSEKLTILNMLCDEVLVTEEIRQWIDDQISGHAEKSKEQKERIHAAKDKEKHLKKKMQDEVARAIEKKGAPLSISEHDALLLQIKTEAAEAHNEMLESISMFKKRKRTCEALRTENLHMDTNGLVYWRLNCLSNSSEVLVQDVGTYNTATSEERWYSLDDAQKVLVEKHVNSSRIRRKRRGPRLTSSLPCRNSEACCGN